MTRGVVYLPIEIKHRELPSRLVIASHLLNAGCAVVIGNHWSMTEPSNCAALPAGIFLYKTVNAIQGASMAGARAAGHIIAANDEECLAFTEYNGYVSAFSEDAAAACDVFFAQSDIHKAAVESRFPALVGKVQSTGNPRIALLAAKNRHIFSGTDDRVAPLKPYILFNTNFSTINSFWNTGGSLNMSVHEETGAFDGPDRQQKEREFAEIVAWEKMNHTATLALLRWSVENIGGLHFVVRPHPGERAEYWQQLLKDTVNAVVVTDSDPHPWVMGAELLVHTCCTTGLEAALLGTPALNLQPVERPHYGHMTSLVNATLRSPTEAAKAMVEFLSRGSGPIAQSSLAPLETYLPDYRAGTATRMIAEGLVKKLAEVATSRAASMAWRGVFSDPIRTDVQKKKFTANQAEIALGLTKAMEVAGVRSKVQIAPLGDSLFMIAPG